MPKNNIIKFNKEMKELDAQIKFIYQLIFFRRNFKQRIAKSFNDNLTPDEFMLLIDVWEYKLEILEKLISKTAHKKKFLTHIKSGQEETRKARKFFKKYLSKKKAPFSDYLCRER